MIDVSKYEKIGEYRNGEMIWISQKKENIVYLIMFGNESYIARPSILDAGLINMFLH